MLGYIECGGDEIVIIFWKELVKVGKEMFDVVIDDYMDIVRFMVVLFGVLK